MCLKCVCERAVQSPANLQAILRSVSPAVTRHNGWAKSHHFQQHMSTCITRRQKWNVANRSYHLHTLQLTSGCRSSQSLVCHGGVPQRCLLAERAHQSSPWSPADLCPLRYLRPGRRRGSSPACERRCWRCRSSRSRWPAGLGQLMIQDAQSLHAGFTSPTAIKASIGYDAPPFIFLMSDVFFLC